MKNRQRQKDTLFSILIFCSAFAVNLLIQKLFTMQTLVPMIFVFGVFLISLKTHGYCYGITSAIVSVFAVNFAFTYPYYAFDFFVEESIFSDVDDVGMKSHFGNKISITIIDNMCKIYTLTECHITNFSKRRWQF